MSGPKLHHRVLTERTSRKSEDNLKVLCWYLKMEEELSYQHRYVATFGWGGEARNRLFLIASAKEHILVQESPFLT